MTPKVFERMSRYVYEQVGIKLTPAKRIMLEARLQKRLRTLGFDSYEQYAEYLFTARGQQEELQQFIDVVTTNTTEFFREGRHFELLAQKVLPRWRSQFGTSRAMQIWSAGCSFGMEPYTLAMVLADFAERNSGFVFSVLATDISARALQHAQRGIYDEERVESIPESFRKRFLLRSRERARKLVRIAPEIRHLVTFQRLNFMEDFSFRTPMDVIFCRNVIIYFDKPTQERLFSRFCESLRPGGYLFIGHSESLTGMSLPLEAQAPTVYRKV
ncbi:chemotaxis protein methyltransferase [Nitratidesulfovibrio vulgaris str. Hildenborough]|uniref:protein-glutamate O-methyltransferase n=2 Tax=Nitratidesulfovibrio vulgaris TaxID=881 RepID=Q72BN9_NITV2|nr:chemotaxis protein methyltransferase [Nitratidesulfovibrio vulgaris str. Hildenborough]